MCVYGAFLEQSTPPAREGDVMPQVAVYRFSRSNDTTGEDGVSLQFATLKAIKMFNGRNLEETRRVVDSSELDCNGFYPKAKT